ncbi:MAG: oxidative damage protection protein [Gemmatimonadota bacterium]|nr:MAG: oxidative damage protection protein [Gemmatimonadota bacterium]
MAQIPCTRCKQTGEQLSAPPLPTELGNRIYDTICQTCWQEWLQTQTAMINHYGLDLREQDARKFLTQQTETFLFGQPQG